MRLVWLLLAGYASAETFSGKVVGISDGDTITVLHGGRGEAIRLDGIDAPERKQPFSAAAKKHLSDLVFQKTVRVEMKSKDRYQRSVGVIWLPDGRNVNQEMVRAGYAWWYRRYAPRDRKLDALEAEAREARRGLWEEEEPTAPWIFRRGH